jgi:uncharacterized protein with HEPN domain
MAATRSPMERLSDIAVSIEKIGRFLEGKIFEDFAGDALIYDAVVRNLEIISEASRHLGEALKSEMQDVPWRKVADMGNWLRHAYEKTEDRILWETIEVGLPFPRSRPLHVVCSLGTSLHPPLEMDDS